MKKVGFDERLDDIMVCAAIRLQKRMTMASSFRSLVSYLTRVGLWEDMGVQRIQGISRTELEDRAVMALARRLRRARKSGTLRAALQQLNMQELLQPRAKERARQQRTPAALRLIVGEAPYHGGLSVRKARCPQRALRLVR